MPTLNPTDRPDLILVGASCRALAYSAVRAGFRPLACDLYADDDLRTVCEWIQIPRDDYPERLPDHLAAYPPLPLVYTGGLENHPGVLETLCRRHTIVGNPPSVLRDARDPSILHDILTTAGLHSPSVRTGDEAPTARSGWLAKPIRGSGGARIREASSNDSDDGGDNIYFQQRVRGVPAAAVFISGAEETVLVGITLQLVGESWLHAAPFNYCGNVGPLKFSHHVEEQISRAGKAVAVRFGLRGLFGLDLVVDEDTVDQDASRAWTIELNPRYTASVEVLEEALDISALALHVSATRGRKLPALTPPSAKRVVGKAILYARNDVQIGRRLKIESSSSDVRFRIADVPRYGERIRRGRPVITVMEQRSSVEECLRALKESVRAVEALLRAP